MTGSATDTAPPIAHAIGGSLGSALALLLLYPLERARVELQTNTQQIHSSGRTPQDINDKVKPLVEQQQQQQQGAPSRGGGAAVAVAVAVETADLMLEGGEGNEQLREPLIGKVINSDMQQLSQITTRQSTNNKSKSNNQLGLMACLYQLHQRKELYRGVKPVVITMAISNFVFFYMHSFLKQILLPTTTTSANGKGGGGAGKTLQWSLVASTLAGIVNVLLTNPMWVANLRIVTSSVSVQNKNKQGSQQQPRHQNLWKEMKDIIEKEGWVQLWSGTPASLLLVSNPVIQFVAYEQLKLRLLASIHSRKTIAAGAGGSIITAATVGRTGLKPLEAFAVGAIAKAISTLLTYPLQLAQTVLRVQKQQGVVPGGGKDDAEEPNDNMDATTNTTSPPTYKSTLDCLVKIYRHKGIEGWFAGMRTKLLQSVLTAAFTFLTYEQIIRAIMAVHRTMVLANSNHNHHHQRQAQR